MTFHWQWLFVSLIGFSVAVASEPLSDQPSSISISPDTSAYLTNPGSATQSQRFQQGYFTDIANKRALVCYVTTLSDCLQMLPTHLRQQTVFSRAAIRNAIGYKSAMVLSAHDKAIAGVIVLNPNKDIAEQSGSIGLTTYQLPLKQQAQLTLWHELGHLYNIDLQQTLLPGSLSEYQHEWLADIYLLWRIAHHYPQLDLAWQQFHRRNLALINDSANLSHWSAPQLQIALTHYSIEQLQKFVRYEDFIAAVYPLMPLWSERDMAEFSSLIQRTFGAGVVQPLPGYMFWRQPKLVEVLSPTLEQLMGKGNAQLWLQQQFSTVN
ncbi:hypothetical protein [Shewanella saliphila]|uniref:Uncharacterized protein n=1 Tax=Shewanella saliphila TaxID=2282698 RepID=A0ABQ2Q420_9GAMM|nr:hypothetical protein [Shewanella saliphila]MCL1101154.1 hypothetical protein [Shewanella saliphila]GGP46242.1 hypothetical protein GCM10009409_11190 [Shewanella saliphila]